MLSRCRDAPVHQGGAVEQMLKGVFAHFQIARAVSQESALQPLGDTASELASKGLDQLLLAASHPYRAVAIGVVIAIVVVGNISRVTRYRVVILFALRTERERDRE